MNAINFMPFASFFFSFYILHMTEFIVWFFNVVLYMKRKKISTTKTELLATTNMYVCTHACMNAQAFIFIHLTHLASVYSVLPAFSKILVILFYWNLYDFKLKFAVVDFQIRVN